MLYYGMVWYGDVAGEGCGVSCRAFFLSSVFFFGGYANLAVADEVVGMYAFIHTYIHSVLLVQVLVNGIGI